MSGTAAPKNRWSHSTTSWDWPAVSCGCCWHFSAYYYCCRCRQPVDFSSPRRKFLYRYRGTWGSGKSESPAHRQAGDYRVQTRLSADLKTAVWWSETCAGIHNFHMRTQHTHTHTHTVWLAPNSRQCLAARRRHITKIEEKNSSKIKHATGTWKNQKNQRTHGFFYKKK